MTPLARSLVLLACLAPVGAPARGEDEPQLAQVLKRAKDSGALARITCDRFFAGGNKSEEVLLALRARETAEGALECTVQVLIVGKKDGKPGRIFISYTLQAGKLARLEHRFLDDGGRSYSASLRDGAVRWTRKRDGNEQSGEIAWPAEGLPGSCLTFFLACLFDQGLPERLERQCAQDLNDELPLSKPFVLERAEKRDPSGKSGLAFRTEDGSESMGGRLGTSGEELGRLLELTLWDKVLLAPTTKEQAEERFKGFQMELFAAPGK